MGHQISNGRLDRLIARSVDRVRPFKMKRVGLLPVLLVLSPIISSQREIGNTADALQQPNLPWRHEVKKAADALRHSKLLLEQGHVYQFGVFRGRSMKALWTYLHPNKMWGLDSFQGLPATRDQSEAVPAWGRGSFAYDARQELETFIGGNRVGCRTSPPC